MYVSDYGYAASPSVWTSTMSSYNDDTAINNNWMYMGLKEWTISRSLDNSRLVFIVYGDGDINNYGVYNSNAVRAVFNLESSVTYKSGTGTMSDPILIN